MVISIMLIVTVIAVPAMKPALENRKIREAARAVNVYLGSARNHAIELGRPVGVLFLRDPTQGNPCLTLQQVEIPPPYAGDFANSTANVYVSGSALTLTAPPPTPCRSPTIRPSTPTICNGGDYIQFGYQGPLYLTSPSSDVVRRRSLCPQLHASLAYHDAGRYSRCLSRSPVQPDNNNSADASAVAPCNFRPER